MTVPLSLLLAIMTFGLTGILGFATWVVKQVTAISKVQGETAIVMQVLADRAKEDRLRIDALEKIAYPHDRR